MGRVMRCVSADWQVVICSECDPCSLPMIDSMALPTSHFDRKSAVINNGPGCWGAQLITILKVSARQLFVTGLKFVLMA